MRHNVLHHHTNSRPAPKNVLDSLLIGQELIKITTTSSSLASSTRNAYRRILRNHPLFKTRPDSPFQELAADFCSFAAQEFLILVDCYLDWPDIVHKGHNTTTPQLITALKKAFCCTGAPDIVWSDQGPQFTSSKVFQDFSKEWGFQHVTSPTYPQSNGKKEATVKSMKKLIRTSLLLTKAEQYHNTPSRRWLMTGTEAVRTTHSGYTSSPSQSLCTRVAKKCRGS